MKMFANTRACTFPASRPTSSSSSSGVRPRSLTPRTSSEHGTVGSDETRRTSFTDEAQTCFNILLILRQDTQHLISLRNDNLAELEGASASAITENAAASSSRSALLACINESITAATRSINSLGPFLDKYRWPAAGAGAAAAGAAAAAAAAAAAKPAITPGPESPRRLFHLKPRRRRSKSFSESAAAVAGGPHAASPGEGALSPEDMFDWTLALTAQHMAVLVATDRLGTFLESGIADVSAEERRRREARQSWWEQRRGGFENVELIQSLLGRPKRTSWERGHGSSAPAGVANPNRETLKLEEDGEEILTPIMENDDGRSETVLSESFTPETVASTPKGLSARPRHQRTASAGQNEEQYSVRWVSTEPVAPSPAETMPTNEARILRMQTFGSEKPANLPSRYRSSKQRPRIATSPVPSTVLLNDVASEQDQKLAATTGTMSAGHDFASSTELPDSLGIHLLTPPFTPNASPEKHHAPRTDSTSQFRKLQSPQEPSPSPSPDDEIPYRAYTPLNHLCTDHVTQHALTHPTNMPMQSMGGESHDITMPTYQKTQNMAPRVSPGEECSDSMVVSPLEAESSAPTQGPVLVVSPITINESQGGMSALDDEGPERHEPWLEYMARKRQVTASKWSLRRAKTSET
ncbi:unnamed protein product [Discula destructiva]